MKKVFVYSLILLSSIFISCNKDVKNFNDIHFSFAFDDTQIRLDNFGNPEAIPAGNSAQSPDMNLLSVHYIELAANEFTPFNEGAVLYIAEETNAGGDNAIDFDLAKVSAEGEDFLKINLDRLPAGTYKYIRASVAYQNYDITYNALNIPFYGDLLDEIGTVASFIGYNTYITDLTVSELTTTINANKLQGFWGFETHFSGALETYNDIYTGQAPEGATTVVNPINNTSPIPPGSCVITGEFDPPLEITGDETSELFITLSFSTNNSFEWIDTNGNGKWDIDATDTDQTEVIVDMGLRGMIPTWEWKD